MKVIKEYLIPAAGLNIHLPIGAEVLKVGDQYDELGMWVSQTVESELTGTWDSEPRSFLAYATGEPYNPAGKTHVGTALVGDYVWHVFEVTTND